MPTTREPTAEELEAREWSEALLAFLNRQDVGAIVTALYEVAMALREEGEEVPTDLQSVAAWVTRHAQKRASYQHDMGEVIASLREELAASRAENKAVSAKQTARDAELATLKGEARDVDLFKQALVQIHLALMGRQKPKTTDGTETEMVRAAVVDMLQKIEELKAGTVVSSGFEYELLNTAVPLGAWVDELNARTQFGWSPTSVPVPNGILLQRKAR